MKKLLLLSLFFFLYPQISHAEINHLVITQVQITGGTGATNNDFIEIYNPTPEPVELLGKFIVRRTKTGISDFVVAFWSESTIIPPGKFYLLAHADYTSIPVTPDFIFTESIANDNGLAIKQGSNTILDSIAWGESTNGFIEGQAFTTNPTANNSLTRKFVEGAVVDTQDNSLDFELLTANPRNLAYIEPEPTPDPPDVPDIPEEEEEPEEEPEPVYSSVVKIHEFMPNPSGTDSGNEYIKLYSPEYANISGWKLDDEGVDGVAGLTSYVIPPDTHISAGQYITLTIPSGKFALNNSGGDTARLLWPDNHVVDSVTYDTTATEDDKYLRQPNNSFLWTSSLIEVEEEPEEEEDPEEETLNTPNLPNPSNFPDEIIINEFFPEPNKGVEEFLELKNESDELVNLKDWVLSDLAGGYTLEDVVIQPGGLAVIYKSESGIALNNYGAETITLSNPLGEIVAQVEYENAPKNESMNFQDGEYFWSAVVTPGEENNIVGGKGNNALPRTGNDGWKRLPVALCIWVLIWYIYINLPSRKK